MHQTASNRLDVSLGDSVIADDQGGRNDDFVGDVRITTLVPTADTAQQDWAPSSDAGDRALSLVLRSGAEVTLGPAVTLGSGYAFIQHLDGTDPATGEPWTPAAVDAVQAGIEVAP